MIFLHLCSWGRGQFCITTENDSRCCDNTAVQRVQLYDDGKPLPLMQFCQYHLNIVNGETTTRLRI